MFRYAVEERIPASPDEVFAEMLDPAHYHEWAPGVIEAGYRTAGQPTCGHRGYEVRSFYGSRVESTFELTEVDRPRRFGMSFSSGKRLTGTSRFDLTPASTGTKLRVEVEIRGLGRLGSLLRPLFVRLDQKTLHSLRRRFGG